MRRAVLFLSLLSCAGSVACSSAGPKTSVKRSEDLPTRFEDLSAFVAMHIYRLSPADAVSLGLHRFDGELPDRTPAALAEDVAMLERDRAALASFTDAQLTPLQRDERDVLTTQVGTWLFDLQKRDVYRTNPMAYTGAINLDAYILRDYAPAAERAVSTVKLCSGLPAYLAQARTNLVLPLPRTWIDTAVMQTSGLAEFADHEVRTAFAAQNIGPALDACKATLLEHAAWLKQQQAQGTMAYALGKDRFLEMLATQERVTIDLPRLQAIADADLQRNLAAITEAAHAIDPKRPVAEVVRALAEDRPTATEVLGVATADAHRLRQFILDHKIVSIPAGEEASVRESPPFQRWNQAFLDHPGPFETKKLPSFFYISPPDPTWPIEEQRAYITPRADLVFTTAHEVYPGHFVHHLHVQQNPSRVMQSFCTYSTSEGWAHYAEEMMFDAGVAGSSPQARIGMLKEALLRNARFVATLGLHTGGMTVEQATRLFTDKGFVDAGNARQQAVRGTFDPMYLAYTLGKLMIRKLRDDWMAAHPGAALGEFHDAFLSHACAPIPVIRRAMLGPSAGPAL